MKKYVVLSVVFFILFINFSYLKAQFVVSDPASEALLGTLNEQAVTQSLQLQEMGVNNTNSLNTQIESKGMFAKMLKIQQDIKKAYEDNGWAKNLQTVAKLKTLLLSMYCSIKKMDLYVGLNDGLSLSCLGQLQFDQAILNYQASLDYISLAVGAASFSMSQEGRIKTLDDAITRTEKAITKINNFNSTQRISIKNGFHNLVEKEYETPAFTIGRR